MRQPQFLRPWIIGALAWLVLSVILSREYLRLHDPTHLFDLGWLLSLCWVQFGFAGLFHTLRNEQGRRAMPFLLITLLPPLVLYIVHLFLAA